MSAAPVFPEHFSYEELIITQHRDIDNTPPVAVISTLADTAWKMEWIRNAVLGGFPVIVTSGYRCEALERRLCYSAYQQWCAEQHLIVNSASWKRYFSNKAHPQGFGIDFICPRFGPPAAVVAAIKAHPKTKFDQLIHESTWTHESFDPRTRMMSFSIPA